MAAALSSTQHQGLVAPKILVLVGVPGSGKSTLADSFKTSGWAVVSSDLLRSRKGAFEDELGRASKPTKLASQCLVVDRCSVTKQDRKQLLQNMFSPAPSEVWAVYFDKNVEECKINVSSRKDHPTISAERGPAACGRIVESFSKALSPPTTDEGFARVITITSHEESDQFLRSFGLESVAKDTSGFIKYPRTPHISDAGGTGVSRDDLLMSQADADAWVRGCLIVVEEKIDGSNLGISLASDYSPRFQNRSHFVSVESASQWKGLDRWWRENSPGLCQVLIPERHVLFGEWMALQHSILYTKLPAYFVAFDVYDKVEEKFMSRSALAEFLEPTGIPIIHKIHQAEFQSAMELLVFLDTRSAYGARREVTAETDSCVEGIYIRVDNGAWLEKRCKLVRPDFIQGITAHWSSRESVKNRLAGY